MQSVGPLHETPFRPDPVAPEGAGLACSDQATPFQRSINGIGPAFDAVLPTATQSDGEVHETLFSPSLLERRTIGRADQMLPFQLSASLPTARQNLSRGHETAVSTIEGTGACSFHEFPSHRAARPAPTAVQAVARAQETAVISSVSPVGSVCCSQRVPVQRASNPAPTASQAFGDAHETP
jgi:hypothetical protein